MSNHPALPRVQGNAADPASSPPRARAPWQGVRALLLVLLLAAVATPLQASQYQAVSSIGNWTLYRNNGARLYRNFAPPLAIGLESEDRTGAIVIDCRPEMDSPLVPKRYSIRTAQFYLDFVPSMEGLVSNPWYTPVSFWAEDSEAPRYTTRLPFVTGLMLERLSFNLDSLYDEARTVINLPFSLVRELDNQLGGGSVVVARFYDFDGRRRELTFDATGYADAERTLQRGCDRINEAAPPLQ